MKALLLSEHGEMLWGGCKRHVPVGCETTAGHPCADLPQQKYASFLPPPLETSSLTLYLPSES